MIDVEDCVRHGWRYLRLKPYEVYELSYREFIILSQENVEMTHDEREVIAMSAIMNAVASRGKGKQGKIPDITDLYDRNRTSEPEKVDDVFEQQREAMDWLSKFKLTSDKDVDNDVEEDV